MLNLMTIQALIASSASVHSKGQSLLDETNYETFKGNSRMVNVMTRRKGRARGVLSHSMPDALRKPLGEVYYNSKVCLYDEDTNILEIRMTMGTKTETAYEGFHVVRLAIYNPMGEVYDSMEDLYNKVIKDRKLKKNGGLGVDKQGDMRALRASIKGQEIKDGNLPDAYAERYEIDTKDEETVEGWIIPVANTEQTSFGQSFGSSGKVFHLRQPITLMSLVRVSCTCSDYYYTLSPYNYNRGVHLGPKPQFPAPASRKPQRNVEKAPGLCKHLMVFMLLLINGGILESSNSAQAKHYRELVNNRAEKLVIPKRLTDENELRKMYAGVNDTIRKTEYDRKTEAQVRRDFSIFKQVQSRETYWKNVKNGTATPIGAGISYANMRQNFVTRADFYNKQLKDFGKRISAKEQAIKKDNYNLKDLARRAIDDTRTAISNLESRGYYRGKSGTYYSYPQPDKPNNSGKKGK